MTDDSDLLRRYAEDGSEAAFAAFVERHIQVVYAAARRRMNGDERAAIEVAQLVFTDAARHAALLARLIHSHMLDITKIFPPARIQRAFREVTVLAQGVALGVSGASNAFAPGPTAGSAGQPMSRTTAATSTRKRETMRLMRETSERVHA